LSSGSGSADLHEKPLRGNGNNWTYKKTNGVIYGKDWLGQLFMEIRAEIVVHASKKRPAEATSAAPSKKQKPTFKQYCHNI
jgi:hypothetical protein